MRCAALCCATLQAPLAQLLADAWASGLDLQDPRVSPLYASAEALRVLPPMLVQVGGSEMLHDQVSANCLRSALHSTISRWAVYSRVSGRHAACVQRTAHWLRASHVRRVVGLSACFVCVCIPLRNACNNSNHHVWTAVTDTRHQILEFVSKVVGAEGGPVELQVAPEMPHVFQLFAFVQEMPEINDHIAKAGAWIRSQ